MAETVAIANIIADPRCQSRTGLDTALVHEYAEAIKDGAALPPLSTIRAEEGYYLYDGFHRLEAYRLADVGQVAVEHNDGDIWDAIERSCAVNAEHGKRRSSEDTKRSVEKCLEVMAHRGVSPSSYNVAEKCAISKSHAHRIMQKVSIPNGIDENVSTTVSRNGSTYEMDTSNIGKRRPEPESFVMQDGPAVDEDTGEILDDGPEIKRQRVDWDDPVVRMGYDLPPRAQASIQPHRLHASATTYLLVFVDPEGNWDEIVDPQAVFSSIGAMQDRKSTRLNSSHVVTSRMPSSA